MRARTPRPLDMRSMAEGLSYPGVDPRTWGSYGTVDAEDPVVFDEQYGPLVNVTLQPSKTQVRCRVGMHVAGNGEAEYFPFVAGDEVYVLLPEGSERGDCVIVCRLNNEIDKFPAESIAGQDPTTNTFGFRRMRTAYVQEVAGPVVLRQATTEALLSFDTKGSVTLKDGNKAALQMSADAFGYQSGDAKYLLQLDLSGSRFTLQVDDAILTLAGSAASPQKNALSVPGALSLVTLGNPAAEHVVTTEAVFSILDQWQTAFLALWSTAWAAINTPAVGAPLGPVLTTALAAVFGAPAALAATATTAAVAPLNPAIGAAVFGAFASAAAKQPGTPGLGQGTPGIGCPGLLAG